MVGDPYAHQTQHPAQSATVHGFAYQTKPSESLFSSGECRYIRVAKFPYTTIVVLLFFVVLFTSKSKGFI